MFNASFCPNCYQPNPGEYCPQCGQRQAERRITLRKLFTEFLDEQFGVNNRLPRTLKLLLFRPGFLTNEYFGGRIQQHIPPLRLYLLTSVAFFAIFLLTESSPVTIQRDAEAGRARIAADTALQRRAAAPRQGTFVGIRIPYENTDNWVRDAEVNFIFPPLTRIARTNLKRLAPLGEVEATRRIVRTTLSQMPTVFFILLPIYAGLLFLFFRKQRRFYVEHFIFALHLHAFAFLALLPTTLLRLPFFPRVFDRAADILTAPILLAVFLYIYIALKRVYGQGWLKTAAKYAVLWMLYMAVFSSAVLVAAVLALATV
jgi:hypothetical protein